MSPSRRPSSPTRLSPSQIARLRSWFFSEDGGPLSTADQAKVTNIAQQLKAKKIARVSDVTTNKQALAQNHKVQLINVVIQGKGYDDTKSIDAVKHVRDDTKPLIASSDLKVGVTGDAAFNLDSKDAFDKALMIVSVATIGLILVLLLLIFRSPIAALMPIITVFLVQMVATALIGTANKFFDLKSDSSISTILTVVLFGVGTDYILFLLFRYRERLRAGEDRKQAMVTAVSRVGEVIASAAGVVIIAFSALVLSSMGMFKSMGPALAIAVGTTLLAALTLVPAIVSLIGPKVFWPSKSWKAEPKDRGFTRKLGNLVGHRPVPVLIVSGLVMVVLALGSFGFKANFDFNSSTPKTTESMKAFTDMQKGFPAGALDATNVYLESTDKTPLTQAEVEAFRGKLHVKGVGKVSPFDPAKQWSKDKTVAQIDLLLKDSPNSNGALKAVDGPVRDAAHQAAPAHTRALVGGSTSVMADVHTAINRDYTVVFPIAGILIMLVLGLLLRSVVAPWYLIVAVVLGFGATLGTSVLVLQHMLGHDGLIFMIPLIMYLFVVALGTDYNILMVARLREEAKAGHSPREAAANAVKRSASTIASAGVILAGTFGSMMLAGVTMMTEMGFAVATGIAIAAFVMSMFFVPSLTALLGHKAWWPGHGDRSKKAAPAEPERELVGANS